MNAESAFLRAKLQMAQEAVEAMEVSVQDLHTYWQLKNTEDDLVEFKKQNPGNDDLTVKQWLEREYADATIDSHEFCLDYYQSLTGMYDRLNKQEG